MTIDTPKRSRSRTLKIACWGFSAVAVFTGAGLMAPQAIAADSNEPGYTVEPIGTPFEPTYTVENYIQPNADLIAAESNILLKDGDGNISLTTCDQNQSSQIRVNSYVSGDAICFKATGTQGWLKMEIPGSTGVIAGDKALKVYTVKGEGPRVETSVAANGLKTFNGSQGDVTLFEIRLS